MFDEILKKTLVNVQLVYFQIRNKVPTEVSLHHNPKYYVYVFSVRYFGMAIAN